MIKVTMVWVLLLLVVGCARHAETPRPSALTQADQWMVRAEYALANGQFDRAQRDFARAHARYASYDQIAAADIARINQAHVLWAQAYDWLVFCTGDSAQLCAETAAHLRTTDADGLATVQALVDKANHLLQPIAADQALGLRARIAALQGDWVGAEGWLAQLDTDSPDYPWTHLRLLQFGLETGADERPNAVVLERFSVVLSELDESFVGQTSDPIGYARLLRYRAWLAAQQHDYAQAIAHGEAAVQLYRDEYHRLGLAYALHELAHWHDPETPEPDYLERARRVRNVL